MIAIRTYKEGDAALLTDCYNGLHPTKRISPEQLGSRLSAWSRTWVICLDAAPVGYACVAPLPGLPGQYDLDVMIGQAWQRQRLGSRLVDFVKAELAGSDIVTMSWGVPDYQRSIADFLLHNGFNIEHEEQILARPHLDNLPFPPHKPALAILTYPRRKAIHTFCSLYEASFTGHPWYQPYTTDEVAADLISPQDILFLTAEKRPFGFAWLHVDENNEGKVEPIGIIPTAQSMGNGRFLFLTALHQLKQRGARRAIIGAWANNTPAITLYQSLGFSHQQTITYYSYSIQSAIQNRKS